MFYSDGVSVQSGLKLAGKRVLVYGLGRSGRGAARFLAQEGVGAEWLDARPAAEDLALMEELAVAITKETVRVLQCSENAVDIIFTDVKKQDWATAGVPWSEKS